METPARVRPASGEVMDVERLGGRWEQFVIRQTRPEQWDDPYWQVGENMVRDELLALVHSANVTPELAFELGCGLGRILLPLSRNFRQAIGVDISAGMIHRVADFAKSRGVINARFAVIRGPGDLLSVIPDAVGRVNFLACFQVFPHIQDFSTIELYLRGVHSLLEPQGIAYLSFDTRPRTPAYYVKTTMPDIFLPRCWQRGMRRIRRDPARVEDALTGCGLRIVQAMGARTGDHRYVVRPSNTKCQDFRSVGTEI